MNSNNTLLICPPIFKKINELFLEKNNIENIEINPTIKIDLENGLVSDTYQKYDSIYLIIDEVFFDKIQKIPKTIHENSILLHDNFDTSENWKKFIEKFDARIHFIFVDYVPESYFLTKRIIYFLNSNERCSVITSRYITLTHERLYNNIIYLPMLYSFYYLNFSSFPKLDYSPPKNPKYDFITYLGESYKIDKINERLEFLKHILNEDLSRLKYKEYDNFTISPDNMGPKQIGHAWNLINSLSAKIQLIFENMLLVQDDSYNHEVKNRYFLTEKLMKLFLLPHPYIAFLPDFAIESLKRYGFRFSYDGNDYKTLLSNIKKDIDGWITENESDFYHNQQIFYSMVNSVELEHHLILKKIINKL
jgi:hypothetical protein